MKKAIHERRYWYLGCITPPSIYWPLRWFWSRLLNTERFVRRIWTPGEKHK